MKTKKITALILSSCLLFSCSAVFASNEVDVIVKDSLLVSSQNAFLKNNITYVPMRSIFEKLGAQVSWDKNTNIVTATKDGKKVEIKKPYIVKGHTMVPLRYVSEALGSQVNWEQATQTAYIDSKIPEFSTEKYVGVYSRVAYSPQALDYPFQWSIFIHELKDGKFLIVEKHTPLKDRDKFLGVSYWASVAERYGKGLRINHNGKTKGAGITLHEDGSTEAWGDQDIVITMRSLFPELDEGVQIYEHYDNEDRLAESMPEIGIQVFYTLKTDGLLNIRRVLPNPRPQGSYEVLPNAKDGEELGEEGITVKKLHNGYTN